MRRRTAGGTTGRSEAGITGMAGRGLRGRSSTGRWVIRARVRGSGRE